MCIEVVTPKSIYFLKGIDSNSKYKIVASSDVPGLQKVLTYWLRGGGSGFISKLEDES